jgi:p-cumate 2,3-dioxygenase beta subunit
MNIHKNLVEDFLYHEAELLDNWKLEEWTQLFVPESFYLIPPTDEPNADHKNTLFIIADDHFKLVQRAKRLLKKEAHVEYPHSTTRHMISNVRIKEIQDNAAHVTCNFAVYRTKRQVLDTFVGHCKYKLTLVDDQLKIQEKRVILDLDALRPHGKVSIIL